ATAVELSTIALLSANLLIRWPSSSDCRVIVYWTLVVHRTCRRNDISLSDLSESQFSEEDFQFAGASASRTAVRSSSSSKGLARNADAPAVSAVERTSGSSFPVKMMTRVEGEISRSWD